MQAPNRALLRSGLYLLGSRVNIYACLASIPTRKRPLLLFLRHTHAHTNVHLFLYFDRHFLLFYFIRNIYVKKKVQKSPRYTKRLPPFKTFFPSYLSRYLNSWLKHATRTFCNVMFCWILRFYFYAFLYEFFATTSINHFLRRFNARSVQRNFIWNCRRGKLIFGAF